MKLAVITDSSSSLTEAIKPYPNLYELDIQITIDKVSYGANELSDEAFYDKMAQAEELPKTAQPNVSQLENLLGQLADQGYTHVLGLFLSSGISGFYQNAYYLQAQCQDMQVVFLDSLITSLPLGYMVETALTMAEQGADFATIQDKLKRQISTTRAYIIVDDLAHLVKGGRLSNGAALLGTLLQVKPILTFDKTGKIVVYEKVRTQKKALKQLIKLVSQLDRTHQLFVIHSQRADLATDLSEELIQAGFEAPRVGQFNPVIGTHLGSGAIAIAFTEK